MRLAGLVDVLGVVVEVLGVPAHRHAVRLDLGALAGQEGPHVRLERRASERGERHLEACPCENPGPGRQVPDDAGLPPLNQAVAYVRPLTNEDLGDADDLARAAVAAHVSLDDLERAVLARHHQHAGQGEAPGHQAEADRVLERNSGRDPHQHAAAPRRRVDRLEETVARRHDRAQEVAGRSAVEVLDHHAGLACRGVHFDEPKRPTRDQGRDRERLVEAPGRADVDRRDRGRVALGEETGGVGVPPEVARAVGQFEWDETRPRLVADGEKRAVLACDPRKLLDVVKGDSGGRIDDRTASQRSPPFPAR